MADRIKARAASITAQGSALVLVLVFDDADGVRQQVEYTYDGDDAVRFADEMKRQRALGQKLAARAESSRGGDG